MIKISVTQYHDLDNIS